MTSLTVVIVLTMYESRGERDTINCLSKVFENLDDILRYKNSHLLFKQNKNV